MDGLTATRTTSLISMSIVLGCSGVSEPDMSGRTVGLVAELSWFVGSWTLSDGGCGLPHLGGFMDVDSLGYDVQLDVHPDGGLFVDAGGTKTTHTVETWQGPLNAVCTFCDATRTVSWMELEPVLRFERWSIDLVSVQPGGIHIIDGVQKRNAELKNFDCGLTFAPPGAPSFNTTFVTGS